MLLTAGYTSDKKSAFAGVVQQNYWDGDKWRFTGIGGTMDFSFTLIPLMDGGKEDLPDWNISGLIMPAAMTAMPGICPLARHFRTL
jgi:hypothetical protein